MKVLLISQFDYGQIGPSFQKAFEELGAEVKSFDFLEEYKRFPLAKNRYFSFVFRWQYAAAMSRLLYRDALSFRPDLLFITKGHWIHPNILKGIHSLGTRIFNFYPDSPFFYANRSYGHANTSKWVCESFSLYDGFFTFAHYLIPRLREAGCPRVEYCPFARDPQLHAPYEGNDNVASYRSDICFVGNLDAERIKWLLPLTRYDLKLWGENLGRVVPKNSSLYPKIQGGALYGRDFAKAMNGAKISLNLLRQVNMQSHNMRTFEIPSCRGFTLSNRNAEVVQLFQEGKEAAYFSAPEELVQKVDYYLHHSQERERIAQAGWDRVRDDTYTKRAEQILEIYRSL